MHLLFPSAAQATHLPSFCFETIQNIRDPPTQKSPISQKQRKKPPQIHTTKEHMIFFKAFMFWMPIDCWSHRGNENNLAEISFPCYILCTRYSVLFAAESEVSHLWPDINSYPCVSQQLHCGTTIGTTWA